MNAAIKVENLSVNYGAKTIIHNFNLSIPNNSFLAIVGHNGCGKSTLLKTIAKSQNSYFGRINVFGKPLDSYQKIYKEGILSFLSQNNQIGFDIKVKDLLLMGRHRFSTLFSNYSIEDMNFVEELAFDLNISTYLNKSFLELSGGEQQLILFAQVILQDAQIIILDEPTQNLDIKNGYKLIQLLNKLVKEKNKTVIVSTHDLHHLTDVEGSILNMNSGLRLDKINADSINKNIEMLRV